jgi:DNA polymerase V
MVFITTSPFADGEPRYSNSATRSLPAACRDTGELIAAANRILDEIWRPGFRYMKAGVLLLDLVPEAHEQGSLFATPKPAEADGKQALMGTLDRLNQDMGRGVVRFAAEGLRKAWRMRQERRSPAYTTRWDELPRVKAS